MEKYAGLILNDFTNGKGVCVSFFTQGCPHHCKGCHNPETWNYSGGKDLPPDIEKQINEAISANNIIRNFSVLGGEPLCQENLRLVDKIITSVRAAYPTIKIFVWTGYRLEELQSQNNKHIQHILSLIDVLIDGKYEENLRDITLELRGSSNQRILQKNLDF